jgi:hypothetical protein
VRHVRMLVLCLVAMFATSAMAFAVASPAMAKAIKCTGQEEKCEQEREKELEEEARVSEPEKLAKFEEKRTGDPYSPYTWGQYKHCSWETKLYQQNCFTGITLGGGQGGYFEFGQVKVPLSKSIVFQGSFTGEEEEIQVEPAVGVESLEAPELPVKGGIGLFSKRTQEIEEWPAALKESWKEAKANRETAVDVKIEMAGNGCFEELGCLDPEHILFEEGIAFKLPLKVKITAPWLEKLGSEPCYIGSDEHPIHINLTTAGPGASGAFTHNYTLTNNDLVNSKLVDLGWHIEQASLPTDCGGAYAPYIDASLADVLEDGIYSHKTGIVVLKGDLHVGGIRNGLEIKGPESGEL